jgi:hypothetical protein
MRFDTYSSLVESYFWLQYSILDVYRTSFDLDNHIPGYCDVDIMCKWSTIEPRCSGSDLQEISQFRQSTEAAALRDSGSELQTLENVESERRDGDWPAERQHRRASGHLSRP